MKILIVIDDYFNNSNGLSISTQRFVHALKDLGQDVRILASNSNGTSDYSLPVMTVPIVHGIIAKQGFHFAKPIKSIMQEAVEWADIVHLETPFPLSWQTATLAKKLHKPVSATMHIYPENGTASVPLLDNHVINNKIMKFFRDKSFKDCNTIICPTTKVKRRLESFHFPQKLVVISNGIDKKFIANFHNYQDNHPFTILCIGRYSHEKEQETLFHALKYVKHVKNMRVIFAGQGPLKEYYQKLAAELPIKPEMHYFSPDKLKEIMSKSDLVVHCASVEVEGMAVMEAFASGCVPIIADSPLSSTASYALSAENKFPVHNNKILAERINYWHDHSEELKKMSHYYQNFAQDLTVKKSAEKLLHIFQNEIIQKTSSH